MHELSLVYSIVETVEQYAKEAHAKQVNSVKVRLGALSGVSKDALLFSYDIGAAGTILSGSTLEIEECPVAIFCLPCGQLRVLPGIQKFSCPECDTPSGDVRQGRELDIVSIEMEID